MVRSPEQMLEDAISIIRDKEDNSHFKKANKMLIISVNTKNNNYEIGWMQAGMKMSECISLCEVAKMKFLSEMAHIVTPENLELMLER